MELQNNMMSQFHQMEVDNNLFDLEKEKRIPLWDLLRVYIFNDFIVKNSIGDATYNKSTNNIWRQLSDLILLFFKRGRFLFIESARETTEKGYYDKISKMLIDKVPNNKRIIIDVARLGYTEARSYRIQLLGIIDYLLPVKNISYHNYSIISDALKRTFDINIPYSTINSIYKHQKHLINRYRFLFRILKPQKVFVSADLNKPLYYVAKCFGVKTYELQHAGIIYEYASYSYPSIVNSNWNIAFADYYLMLGEAWGSVNNIPAKRIVLGNDYFLPQVFNRHIDNDYIIFVSTLLHYESLIPIAKQYAQSNRSMEIIYKLHPEEYENKDYYIKAFENFCNVKVICNEVNLQDLLYYCRLVVLVYSSVCFEALNYNKPVAVVKGLNYGNMLDACKGIPSVQYMKDVEDINKMLEIESKVKNTEKYYEHFNEEIAWIVLSE